MTIRIVNRTSKITFDHESVSCDNKSRGCPGRVCAPTKKGYWICFNCRNAR